MTQTRTIPPMNGTLLATAAGTRKIPEPITEPTTAENAPQGPSTRGSLAASPLFVRTIEDSDRWASVGDSPIQDRDGRTPRLAVDRLEPLSRRPPTGAVGGGLEGGGRLADPLRRSSRRPS